jgi:hypothetical protein
MPVKADWDTGEKVSASELNAVAAAVNDSVKYAELVSPTGIDNDPGLQNVGRIIG